MAIRIPPSPFHLTHDVKMRELIFHVCGSKLEFGFCLLATSPSLSKLNKTASILKKKKSKKIQPSPIDSL